MAVRLGELTGKVMVVVVLADPPADLVVQVVVLVALVLLRLTHLKLLLLGVVEGQGVALVVEVVVVALQVVAMQPLTLEP